LVKRISTDDYFAMKLVKIGKNIDESNIKSINNEINVLRVLAGDSVVKAMFTFRYNNYLCVVMEYMGGGEFGEYLDEVGRIDDDMELRNYVAELVLA
jgi:serine/threonine protein kinase